MPRLAEVSVLAFDRLHRRFATRNDRLRSVTHEEYQADTRSLGQRLVSSMIQLFSQKNVCYGRWFDGTQLAAPTP